MNYNPVYILLAMSLFIFVMWGFQKKAAVNGSLSFIRPISFPVKSLLLFVGFQMFLFPFMILTGALGFETINNAIHYLVALQSFVTTSLFNFLIYGKRYPAAIEVWLWIGIALHAVGGLFLGRLLQNRFTGVKQSACLLGSLIIFESALIGLMAWAVSTSLWLHVWQLPPGW